MVTYDDTANVYEAWGDTDCSIYLGSFATYAEARRAVEKGA